MKVHRITVYRDDSTTQVVYENVKHIFWLAGNTVLCIAQYDDPPHTEDLHGIKGAPVTVGAGKHHYVCWLREHFVWYKDEPT